MRPLKKKKVRVHTHVRQIYICTIDNKTRGGELFSFLFISQISHLHVEEESLFCLISSVLELDEDLIILYEE